MTWPEVEELKYEIQTYNLDVKLWESFSNLERQDAFDFPDNQEEFLPLEGEGEFVFSKAARGRPEGPTERSVFKFFFDI